jgi:hypothetical protein
MNALTQLAWLAWLTIPFRYTADRPWEHVLYRVNQIRVIHQDEHQFPGGRPVPYNYLMRGDTHRGLNYQTKELRRLATTYHHRRSPVGMVMEQFTWFHDVANAYHSDARMAAGIVGTGPDVWGQLGNVWSEPPVGVVGMYVGGMASYARPLQYVDFYESDPNIIRLSVPGKEGPRYFNYLHDARQRGAVVRVFQGEERQTLSRRGPDRFYHVLVLEICPRDRLEDLSVNLLTKEGMALCFEKLAPEGILCVHVSNRYLKVVPVVADVAQSLGLAAVRGHDQEADRATGAFTSEWVMVARSADILSSRLKPPPGHDAARFGAFWEAPAATGKHVWTDRGWNSVRGLMYSDPGVSRLEGALREMVNRWANRVGYHGYVWYPAYSSLEPLNRLMVGLRGLVNQRVESLGDPHPAAAAPARLRPAAPGRAPAAPGASARSLQLR